MSRVSKWSTFATQCFQNERAFCAIVPNLCDQRG